MPNIYKAIRDAMRTCLADATNGFNVQLAALEDSYGITAFAINWTSSSRNFVQAYLDPEALDVSKVCEFPAVVLYTAEAVNERRVKYQKFSGQVLAHVDFYLRYRLLKDPQIAGNATPPGTDDFESIADAVVDAAVETFWDQKATLRAAGALWAGEYRIDRDPVQQFGDGQGQRIAITLGFERHT